jgi:hypothetical protein
MVVSQHILTNVMVVERFFCLTLSLILFLFGNFKAEVRFELNLFLTFVLQLLVDTLSELTVSCKVKSARLSSPTLCLNFLDLLV